MNLNTKVLLLAAAFLLVRYQPHTDAAILFICNWFIIYLFLFAESYVFWDELSTNALKLQGHERHLLHLLTSALKWSYGSYIELCPLIRCFYDNCRERRWLMLFWANCTWSCCVHQESLYRVSLHLWTFAHSNWTYLINTFLRPTWSKLEKPVLHILLHAFY